MVHNCQPKVTLISNPAINAHVWLSDSLALCSFFQGDLAIWEIVDLHLRIFNDELKAEFPDLVAFHAKIAAIPAIAAYLAGPT